MKYTKHEGAEYLSHLDCLRVLTRSLRRAKIPTEYSKGFNPHINIFLGKPLSLGIKSISEYVVIDTKASADTVLTSYNKASLDGLKGLKAKDVEKNPNIPALTFACEYALTFKNDDAERALELLRAGGVMTYERNGKAIEDDFSLKILGLTKASDTEVSLIGKASDSTLRISHLLEFVCSRLNLERENVDCIKTRTFFNDNGVLKDMDLLFK